MGLRAFRIRKMDPMLVHRWWRVIRRDGKVVVCVLITGQNATATQIVVVVSRAHVYRTTLCVRIRVPPAGGTRTATTRSSVVISASAARIHKGKPRKRENKDMANV